VRGGAVREGAEVREGFLEGGERAGLCDGEDEGGHD